MNKLYTLALLFSMPFAANIVSAQNNRMTIDEIIEALKELLGYNPFPDNGSGNPPPSGCSSYNNDGSIDFSENGANWCGQCESYEGQQSPIELPLNFTFNPNIFDLDANITFGNVDSFYVNTTQDYIKIDYDSNGGLFRFQGETDEEVYNEYYCPTGHMKLKSPAEHKFFGKPIYDVELQIEYRSFENTKAYISLFFDRRVTRDEPSGFLGDLRLWQPNRVQNRELDLNALFEDQRKFTLWHYVGSETTPPCQAHVDWFLIDHPYELSEIDYQWVANYFQNNTRELQPFQINNSSLEWLDQVTPTQQGFPNICLLQGLFN